MEGNILIFYFFGFFVILQLLEAAWCLTNIAAGKPEETEALLPSLPLLIAHLGGWQGPMHPFLCEKMSYFLILINIITKIQKKTF